MALQKILIADLTTGQAQQYSPAQVSSGASSAGAVVALNGAGQVDATMLPASQGLPSVSLAATEAIAAGALVNVWMNGANTSIRNANATDATKPATGFVLAAVASGANGTVNFGGAVNTGATGLTTGAPVFLSATAGGSVSAAPNTAGNLLQYVGWALSNTEYTFNPSPGIIL